MGKAAVIVGIIILLAGLFYAGAPHTIHTGYGVGFGLDHTYHIMLGIILILIGLVIVWKGRG